jgi:predicted amidohydrolase YtcJ
MGLLAVAWGSAVGGAGCRTLEPPRRADLIITNANVWTVDSVQPRADAVAVAGERIVAVGATDLVDRWRTPETRVINARRRTEIPGYNDAQVHLNEGGRQLDELDLNAKKIDPI